jgi:hypothetical protein
MYQKYEDQAKGDKGEDWNIATIMFNFRKYKLA